MTIETKTLHRCFSLLLLPVLLLAGCQRPEAYYRDYKGDNSRAIQLSGPTTGEGDWKTFDVDLNYQYDFQGQVLNISGRMTLGLFYELNTSRIRSLDLYLFFLNSEAKVLQTELLAESLDYRTDQTLTFRRSLTAPAGTESFVFGYDGAAQRDGGGEETQGGSGGGIHLFYDLPHRPR